jgi:hypothetical protein
MRAAHVRYSFPTGHGRPAEDETVVVCLGVAGKEVGLPLVQASPWYSWTGDSGAPQPVASEPALAAEHDL